MSNLLSSDELRRLETKIAAVESMTSAEFKIIVYPHAWFGIKRKAQKLFKKYNLDQTKERSAVLLLLVEKDREFLIFGDEGIHNKAGMDFWVDIKGHILALFKQGDIASGLSLGLTLLAEELAEHFPKVDDTNEISNAVIFEK